MSGRHRHPRRSAHALPGTASSPALSGAADLVLDLVDPVPDDGAEQWLDGVRTGWTRDSLATVRRYRRFGWVKPLSVAEVRASRTPEPARRKGNAVSAWVIFAAFGTAAAAMAAAATVIHVTGRAAEAAWHLARKAVRRAA